MPQLGTVLKTTGHAEKVKCKFSQQQNFNLLLLYILNEDISEEKFNPNRNIFTEIGKESPPH